MLSKYKILSPILQQESGVLKVVGRSFLPLKKKESKSVPILRHYMVDSSIEKIINHNFAWAKGRREKPLYKFAYLTLPTGCNLRCKGCFAGREYGSTPTEYLGPFYSKKTLSKIIKFLKGHGAEAIVYSGAGELFLWPGACGYIDYITSRGLGMVIFTNGTMLTKEIISFLSKRDVSLIFSFRDTTSDGHDKFVGREGAFGKLLQAVEWACQCDMHLKNCVAAEIPVTNYNEERVLGDFIPAMRRLSIIPMVEEFIPGFLKTEEKKMCHSFLQARHFFEKAEAIDRRFGINHRTVHGQRMLAQPKCMRPLYSFAVFPNGDVSDCPVRACVYGNINNRSIQKTLYSKRTKQYLKSYQYCPCSVFYTKDGMQPT